MTTDAGAAAAAGAGDGGAAAAAAAANGGAGVDWLPGIDGDSTKFVTDLGYKDLPSFVKGAIETKRAFSAGRPFEVPKAEDADSWKKIAAAQGVPETPDKYDLGEVGKTMKPEEVQAWTAELHKIGIPNKAAAALVQIAAGKAAQARDAETAAVATRVQAGFEKLKSEWGDDHDKNYDIANRGWVKVAKDIGWTPQMMEAVERVDGGTRAIHMLGLLLGRHTLEAGFVVSDGQHRGMTKESAAARLREMEGDGTIRKALTDRNDPNHRKFLDEKIALGKIAHG